LFSILERLAGRPEYNVAATPYAHAADEWFAPHAARPAVRTFQRLSAEHGIGYDAAMTLAAHLNHQLQPVGPLDPRPERLDQRWLGVDLDERLEDVRSFASASRFGDFLEAQEDYISEVEADFGAFIADRAPVTWFDAHLGIRENAEYHVVPGLLTGLMNYGMHVGPDAIYAVIWLEAPDDDGRPHLGLLSEELLVHELAHSYVNPLVRAHLAEFAESSPLLDAAAPAMASQHYPTVEIVIDESIVRALTVLYLRDEVDAAAADASLATHVGLGFSWMTELVDALDALRSGGGGSWNENELIASTAAVLGLDR
jgi:hypothetical protein